MKPAGPLFTAVVVALFAAPASAKDLPNFDSFSKVKPLKVSSSNLRLTQQSTLLRPGMDVQMEQTLGVPTFLWASKQASAKGQSLARWSTSPEQAARNYLADFAPMYRATAKDVEAAEVSHIHDTGLGGIIVKFRQTVGGVPVFRNEVSVMLTRNLELVAVSGYLTPSATGMARSAAPRFALPAEAAVAKAFEDLNGASIAPSTFFEKGSRVGGYSQFALTAGAAATDAVMVQPARVRSVMFDQGDRLEPAYYVELNTGSPKSTDSDYYSYVVSAATGGVLYRKNLTEYDAYSYRVWADTSGKYIPLDGPAGNAVSPKVNPVPDQFQAPFIAPSLVTLQNSPYTNNDPWLPTGATATVGNNADAFADLFTPDGYGPVGAPSDTPTTDFRAVPTAPGVFDRTYDVTLEPGASANQRQAAITQLFFNNNFLHDWYYDSGFDEAAGNAQVNNFGRGGLGNDSIRAEAQDFGGTDNANMSTPSDGARPRMQMYVFTANSLTALFVTAPASIAGRYAIGTALYGPTAFDVTNQVVLAIDPLEAATGSSTTDGCSPLTNTAAIAGKIALIDRGVCTFKTKTRNAELAGAVGVIIRNLLTTQTFGGLSDDATVPAVNIPTYLIQSVDGTAIGNQLATGVTARMVRETPGVRRDGTIDNTIVAHEWGHYISNRLIVDANGLTNIMGRGMGEGWADFHALLMVTKDTDAAVASNPNWTGVFPLATYVTSGGNGNDGYYFGIRRVPYSRDFAKNGLTFKHIQNGVALPSAVPTGFGLNGANNAEVHNSGEVWTTMLWEAYTELLRDPRLTFQQAQDRMKAYVVAGYKMTPANPTLLEARDAILAAAQAADEADYQLIGAGFARRGAGIGAIGPDRFSSTNIGVQESFDWGHLKLVSATLDDSNDWCDHDGILDSNESGVLTVKLQNLTNVNLTATTATVTTSTSGITFANGGAITFASSAPGAQVSGTVQVTSGTLTALSTATFSLAYTDNSVANPKVVHEDVRFRVAYDEVPASAKKDDAQTTATAWTVGWDADYDSEPGHQWQRIADPDGSRRWFAPDTSEVGDHYLVSPPLVVGTAPFTFTFKHRYSFEQSPSAQPPSAAPTNYWDAGVVEISTDNGATWNDVGVGSLSPTYASTALGILAGDPLDGYNPIASEYATVRRAYGGVSAAYPAWVTVTANLGTTFANQTVLIRFREGNDAGGMVTGWEIDDIDFSTGITNTPFAANVADRAICRDHAPVANAGPDQAADERTTVTLDGSASADRDNETLTFNWTQTAGPSVTLSNANTNHPSFTAPEVTGDTTLTFSLVVNDGTTSSAADSVNVLVHNVNRAPVANAGPDQDANERTTVTLNGSASSDPDGDVLTFTWTQTAGPAVTLTGGSTTNPTFTAPDVSSDTTLTFSLNVSDGPANNTDTVNVVVHSVNRAPVANAGPDQTVDERTTVTLNGSASSDPDSDALAYAWVQTAGPAVTLTGATTAQPTFTSPEVTSSTAVTFSLVVNDGTVDSAADSVTISISNVNRVPVANAGPDQTLAERTTATLDGTASSDLDGDTLTYHWNQTAGPAVTLSNAAAAQPTFTTPDVATSTALTFSLVVNDGAADSAADTVTITVTNVNRAPTANAGPDQTVNDLVTVTLDGTGSTDPDGDALTYAWTQTAGPAVTLSSNTAAQPTFTAPDVTANTVFTFSLVVSDGVATSTADSVSITVHDGNSAPVANAGPDQTVNERATATLDGSGSTDPDGDTLTYAWTQTSGPTVTLSSTSAAQPTFTTPEVTGNTDLVFSLVVSDGALSSTADTVTITVTNVNRAPVANAGPDQSVDQGATVTLDGSGSTDPDGDTLTYAWTQTAGPTVTLTGGTTAAPTFTAPTVTTATAVTLSLVVSDGTASSVADEVTITVNPTATNGAPTANAGAAQTVTEGAHVTLAGSGTDPDGDPLTYHWTQTSGATVTLTDADKASAGFTAPSVTATTTLKFRLTVSDDHGHTATSDVTITVNDSAAGANKPPVADAGADQVVDSGAMVVLHANGSIDPENKPLTYSWKLLSGSAVSLSDSASKEPSFTAPTVDDAGETLTFELTVTDAGGLSATDTVTVQVVEGVPNGGGCGCTASNQNTAAAFPMLLLGAVVFLARRRRSA